MIHPDVARHLPDIQAICQEFDVVRLEVYGSAVTDRFDPCRSDVDLIATFPEGYSFGPWGERLNSFEARLGEVLGRPAHVVLDRPFRNRFFAAAVNAQRIEVYRATDLAEAAG